MAAIDVLGTIVVAHLIWPNSLAQPTSTVRWTALFQQDSAQQETIADSWHARRGSGMRSTSIDLRWIRDRRTLTRRSADGALNVLGGGDTDVLFPQVAQNARDPVHVALFVLQPRRSHDCFKQLFPGLTEELLRGEVDLAVDASSCSWSGVECALHQLGLSRTRFILTNGGLARVSASYSSLTTASSTASASRCFQPCGVTRSSLLLPRGICIRDKKDELCSDRLPQINPRVRASRGRWREAVSPLQQTGGLPFPELAQ